MLKGAKTPKVEEEQKSEEMGETKDWQQEQWRQNKKERERLEQNRK